MINSLILNFFTGLFAFGTVAFWILFFSLIIFILYVLEDALDLDRYRDNNGGGTKATIGLGVFFLLYWLCGSRSDIATLFTWIGSNFLSFILFTLGFFAVGAVWSIFKWNFFLLKVRDRIMGISPYAIQDDEAESYKKSDQFKVEHIREIPTVEGNKSRIMSWIFYWPFSLSWTLLDEPFRRLVSYIYKSLGGIYKQRVKAIFGDFYEAKKNVDALKAQQRK